jgi:YVTN family beta-propeller protein
MGRVAFGADAVWFLSGNLTVSRISPASATVIARVRYSGQGSGVSQPSIAAGEDAVWVSAVGGVRGGVLTRIDPRTNERVTTVQVPAAGPVVAGLGGVWVADMWFEGESVWQIDPGANRAVRSIHVGPLPLGIALGAGAVWVTTSDGTVSKIDPTSRKVIARIRVGGTPSGIAVGEGFVWVARA